MLRAAALALLLLAPLAVAGPADVDVSIDALPFVEPLRDHVAANVTIRVPCALAVQGSEVALVVTQSPAWANVIVSPTRIVTSGACEPDAKVAAHAQVVVTASDQAPADKPDKIVVTATVHAPTGDVAGRNETAVVAGWFPLLDAQLAQSVFVVAPGGELVAPLKLTNLGNGATLAHFTWTNGSQLSASVPDVSLESKQQGGSRITSEIPITLRSAPSDRYLNHVDTITIRYAAVYAKDPTQKADTGTVSIVVTTRGGPINAKSLPDLGLPAALAIILCVAARRARR